ncbi:signal peptide peptidase SppA [Pseudoduganella albidiflava]|uniref:Protease n=1 Tax=Pseudoduganella albidiflava TaxID=321983 RepID=A0A411WVE8_9BURK|nr:signal peptide peptidase SppA [Pseudoduganella albidiflava]QBI00609.1 signal peptide peptidase SppA [Pseudoduganella albidiflava]GGY32004.1 protease [Pseudoduganella albidiflava]
MSRSVFSYVRGGLGRVWRFIDASRRAVMNLIFLVIVIALLYAIFGGGAKPLGDKTMLVLNLNGQLVEQAPGGAKLAALANLGEDNVRRYIQLRDVLRVLDNAARDPDIAGALLLVDEMEGGGPAMQREIAAAIDRFRAGGKRVVAWGSNYNQGQYQIAAHASEVYLHPMGTVILDGYGKYRTYYREALDKLGVTVNLLKVGNFKSAAEPLVANGPSPAAMEAEAYLNNDLWNRYLQDVEQARKLPSGTIARGIDNLPALMEQHGGNLARLAQGIKLVDGLKTRDEIRVLVLKHGVPDPENKSFRQVGFDEYLARLAPRLSGDAIGVVMAVGEIGDGIAAPGSIGGLSTSNLIRMAREDDNIKAIVLRVDSPGGSAFGSELIRRELELTRAAGKPVVVSMGNLAASGGYWISMASDEVIADASTITGSIGVFALFPTFDKVMDKLGIHSGGQPTTWLGDAGNPTRPMDPRFGQLLQSSINHVYAEFTTKAAQARKSTPEKIDAVAQGRVWTGAQAQDRGLVDTLGSFNDAVRSAARRAKLGADPRIVYIERETTRFDKLLDFFGAPQAVADLVDAAVARQVGSVLAPAGIPAGMAGHVVKELNWLNEMTAQKKPFMALTHCLCGVPE